MKIYIMAFVLGLTVAATSCKKNLTEDMGKTPEQASHLSETDDDPKTVKGKLKKKNTNTVIADADVYLFKNSTGICLDSTNSSDLGTFQFLTVYPDNYHIVIIADGYLPNIQYFTVPNDSSTIYDLGDIGLSEE